VEGEKREIAGEEAGMRFAKKRGRRAREPKAVKQTRHTEEKITGHRMADNYSAR
jgi:hypothetical protein